MPSFLSHTHTSGDAGQRGGARGAEAWRRHPADRLPRRDQHAPRDCQDGDHPSRQRTRLLRAKVSVVLFHCLLHKSKAQPQTDRQTDPGSNCAKTAPRSCFCFFIPLEHSCVECFQHNVDLLGRVRESIFCCGTAQ